MAQGRGTRAAGEDEVLQGLQVVVEAIQLVFQVLHLPGGDHLHARYAHLTAQVEEIMLDIGEQGLHVLGQSLAQQYADGRIDFIHLAQGVDAQAVLGNPPAVAEAGGAGVAGTGVDLGKAVAHGCGLLKAGIWEGRADYSQPGGAGRDGEGCYNFGF